MKLSGIRIPGFKIKDGKLAKSTKGMSVCKRIAQAKSNKVRVAKR